MIKLTIEFFKKNLFLLAINNLSYLLLYGVNAVSISFVAGMLESGVSLERFLIKTTILLTLGILAAVAQSWSSNLAEARFQEERQKKYLQFNKLMLSMPFERYDNPEFRALQNKASDFFSTNIFGFESVLRDGFYFVPVLITALLTGALLLKLSPIVFIISLVMYFAKFIALAKVNDFEIDTLLERGGIDQKIDYYRRISLDYKFGKDIRVFGLSGLILGKYKGFAKDLKAILKREVRIYTFWHSLMVLTTLLSDITFYLLSFSAVIKGSWLLPQFFLGLGIYETFTFNYISCLEKLANIRKESALYTIYHDLINGDYDNKPVAKMSVNVVSDTIEFRNVSFKYPGSDTYILEDVNFSLNSKEKVGLVGENGAGKTTLLKLLLGFYEPSSGEILLNEKKAEKRDLAERMTAVFQESNLFAMSLFENCLMTNEPTDSEKEKISTLLEAFNLRKYFFYNGKLQNLPIEKDLDKDGFVPSGGVKQRLLIIRALLQKKKFLILDEPTSSLDAHSEYNLYNTLQDIAVDRGFVIVSHRLAISSITSRILLMSKGKIVGDGSHYELLNSDKYYRELYDTSRSMYKTTEGGESLEVDSKLL
jgi:ATP-binding cassette subfamily B protein